MVLPADGHVHSEWSWDAPYGALARTCARAVELGLPAVAFTEHADYTRWIVEPGELDSHEHLKALLTPEHSGATAPRSGWVPGERATVPRAVSAVAHHQRAGAGRAAPA